MSLTAFTAFIPVFLLGGIFGAFGFTLFLEAVSEALIK